MAGLCTAEHGAPASGSIATLTDCALAFLSTQSLRRLEATDPGTALAFYSQYASALEKRQAQS